MSKVIELQHELAGLVFSEVALPLVDAPPPRDSEIDIRMQRVKWDLVQRVGGDRVFAKKVGDIIRAAVDYVIDAPTLYRYSINDLEPDEKTAIGKRIERMLRFEFSIPKGDKLDIKLAGEDVDIKTTMGKNWMFSRSSHDHINLLLAYDESKSLFRLGLAHVVEHQLGAKNRDEKRSLTAEHREHIYWILKDEPYSQNFLAHQPKAVLDEITGQKTGSKRVLQLLKLANGIPIPRHVICSVANQKDPLRRTRSNGGARDVLWNEGFMVLSGAYECDRAVVRGAINLNLASDETLTFSSKDQRITPQLLAAYKTAHQLT